MMEFTCGSSTAGWWVEQIPQWLIREQAFCSKNNLSRSIGQGGGRSRLFGLQHGDDGLGEVVGRKSLFERGIQSLDEAVWALQLCATHISQILLKYSFRRS